MSAFCYSDDRMLSAEHIENFEPTAQGCNDSATLLITSTIGKRLGHDWIL